LVLELAKEGTFSLQDPVSKFIPFLNAINPELNGLLLFISYWHMKAGIPVILMNNRFR
jgi:hypothetical protein